MIFNFCTSDLMALSPNFKFFIHEQSPRHILPNIIQAICKLWKNCQKMMHGSYRERGHQKREENNNQIMAAWWLNLNCNKNAKRSWRLTLDWGQWSAMPICIPCLNTWELFDMDPIASILSLIWRHQHQFTKWFHQKYQNITLIIVISNLPHNDAITKVWIKLM